MRALLPVLAILLACDEPIQPEPDASPSDASDVTYCESYQSFPPPCYEPGKCTCTNERICQEWDDCESGACVQCRVLYSCECS